MSRHHVVAVLFLLSVGWGASSVSGADEAADADAALYRINCGADEPYTDEAGRTWLADQPYRRDDGWGAFGGQTTVREDMQIEGDTPAPQVYLHERFGMREYRFDLPPGRYIVRLHFAETWVMDEGERVFWLHVGEHDLGHVDVFKEAGGQRRPLVKDSPVVAIEDKPLVVHFKAIVEYPMVNGIEVLAVSDDEHDANP